MTKKKIRQPLIILLLLVILLLVGLGIGYHYYRQATAYKEVRSYVVNQAATLKNPTKLYYNMRMVRSKTNTNNATVTVKKYYLIRKHKKTRTYAKVLLNGKKYYVRASYLNLTMTNAVNKYIAQLGYPHSKITKKIYSKFEQKNYDTDNQKPRGVIIHDTGTAYSTLKGEVSYMEENYESEDVFVHTFVDANQIYNIANTNYMAEGAGPKANPYYVQFEMPHEYRAQSFAKQTANAAYYAAYTLKHYDLPVIKGNKDGTGTVWTHEMVSVYLGGTDHIDPTEYWAKYAKKDFNSTYNIDDFVKLVQAYYNQM